MITSKLTMHPKVLAALADLVLENDIPVHVDVGNRYRDGNGDMQIDILLMYEECDELAVEQAIGQAVQQAVDEITNLP